MTISDARLRLLSELLIQTPIEGSSGLLFHPSQLIGEGGQGWVYRAGYDEPDGPWVVVKLLRPDVVNEEAIARFLREADVLRKLGQTQAPSPNVVRFFDHGIHRHHMPDGETYALPFMVIEYVNGSTLTQLLAQTPGKGLSAARVRRMFRQIARALSLIHGAQIVHRDLKPSNLLVSTEGGQEVVKITDFGLVKRFDVDAKGTMALAGASVGYAPPEQFELGNKRVSPRTDLFAFAAVLYEALAGVPAFELGAGESPFQVLSRILSGMRPILASRAGNLCPELAERRDLVAALDREIGRATSADPLDRHESVFEFWGLIEELLRAASGQGAASHPARPPQPGAASSGSGEYPSMARPPQPSSSNLGEHRVAPSIAPPPVGPAAPILTPRSFAASTLALRPRSTATLPERAWAMALTPDGRAAFALGRFGLCRHDGASWSPSLLPKTLDPLLLRGLLLTPTSEPVVFGEHGAFWGLTHEGFTPWAPAEADLVWQSAFLSSQPAEILLVGELVSQRVSVLGTLRPGQPLARRLVTSTGRLSSVARLLSGKILACGENGELVYIDGTPEHLPWGRTGHLLAALPTPEGGANVVGSGGHALLLIPGRDPMLEPVQTTRDLLCLAVDAQGIPWAGGQDARLLRRSPTGWVRVPLPSAAQGNIRAIAGSPRLTVLLDDGMIFEGTSP